MTEDEIWYAGGALGALPATRVTPKTFEVPPAYGTKRNPLAAALSQGMAEAGRRRAQEGREEIRSGLSTLDKAKGVLEGSAMLGTAIPAAMIAPFAKEFTGTPEEEFVNKYMYMPRTEAGLLFAEERGEQLGSALEAAGETPLGQALGKIVEKVPVYTPLLGAPAQAAGRISKATKKATDTAQELTREGQDILRKGNDYETIQEGPFYRVRPASQRSGQAVRGNKEEAGTGAPDTGGAVRGDVPQPITDAQLTEIMAQPDNFVRSVASQYAEEVNGQPYELPEMAPSSLLKQAPIGRAFDLAVSEDPQYKKRVFEAYGQAMPEVIEQSSAKNYDQLVEAAYRQLAKETDAQFRRLPVSMSFHRAGEGNYSDSKDMLRDVYGNRHLYVFQGGDPHPFLNQVDPVTGLNDNEKFRAVHDFFGHAIHGNQFGPKGEETAWLAHSQMYSPLARLAMSTETRGQNSVVNYTPLNAQLKRSLSEVEGRIMEARRRNQTDDLKELQAIKRDLFNQFQYAPQQGLLLPPEMIRPDYAGKMPDYLRPLIQPAPGTAQSARLTHFSYDPNMKMTDPSRYGTGIKGAEAGRLAGAPDIRPRTYFYTGENPRPETGLGPFRYGTQADLYNIEEDPLSFRALASESLRSPFTSKANPGMVDPMEATTAAERLVKEYGYPGYMNPEFGAATVFQPLEVQRYAPGGKVVKGALSGVQAAQKATKAARQQGASNDPVAPEIKKTGKLAELEKELTETGGKRQGLRLQRAADEIPGLEDQYEIQALRRAFRGRKGYPYQGVMTMDPKEFQDFALSLNTPLSSHSKENIERLRNLLSQGGSFDDVPFLQMDKKGDFPGIFGHEGRHRARALAAEKHPKTLVEVYPLRGLEMGADDEPMSAIEWLRKFNEELAKNNRYIFSEDETNVLKLPDVYAKGGAVKGIKAGIQAAQKATQDARRTPQLEKFLKQSTVKEQVYHGTGELSDDDDAIEEFKTFNPAWFAKEPYTAHMYANTRGGSPTIYPAYLDLKNPLELKVDMNHPMLGKGGALKSVLRKLGLHEDDDFPDWKTSDVWEIVNSPKFMEAAQNAGYDGIKANEGGKETYGVFDSKQIKSSIGNQGTYDPENPIITKADGGAVTMKKGGVSSAMQGINAAKQASKAARRQERVDKNLQRWSGSEEKPPVYYHATSSEDDFKVFNPNLSKSQAKASFLTSTPEFSNNWIKNSLQEEYLQDYPEVKPRVMPAYLRVKKTFDFENPEHVQDVVSRAKLPKAFTPEYVASRIGEGAWSFIEDREIQKAIKDAGFDSFFTKEQGAKNIGVFNPGDIKSVFNRGSYSEDLNISKAEGGAINGRARARAQAHLEAIKAAGGAINGRARARAQAYKNGGEVHLAIGGGSKKLIDDISKGVSAATKAAKGARKSQQPAPAVEDVEDTTAKKEKKPPYTQEQLQATAKDMRRAIKKENPKFTPEQVQAKALEQAKKKLDYEIVIRPSMQKKYGEIAEAPYYAGNLERKQNTPEAIQARIKKAEDLLSKPTEPWNPPRKELQAFDRERIKDALEGFPGIEQTRFPRYQAPKSGSASLIEEIYQDPVNRRLIEGQIKRGLPLGGETFYASLYPLKLAAMERGMTEKQFNQFIYSIAPASARNSIMNEMAVGQFLRDMHARGLPLDPATIDKEKAKFKAKHVRGLPSMPIHHEGVRRVLEDDIDLREMSKASDLTSYKIPTYGAQKAGDFGKSVVLDVHEAGGETLASKYHPYFSEQGGFSRTEYGPAEDQMLQIAQDLGLPGGMAQAGRWFGGGELTGLVSPRGDALDLLEKQTAYTLHGQGIKPTPRNIRNYVLDMMETGQGVLLPWWSKKPMPDYRTQKKKGGLVALER